MDKLKRCGEVVRKTKETDIYISLEIVFNLLNFNFSLR